MLDVLCINYPIIEALASKLSKLAVNSQKPFDLNSVSPEMRPMVKYILAPRNVLMRAAIMGVSNLVDTS